jgi:hypothetical protein
LILFVSHAQLRDFHANFFTGTIPSLSQFENLKSVNFASNFFYGEIPDLPPSLLQGAADFRFNYLTNSSELCLLTHLDCTPQCSTSSTPSLPLPSGVSKSVWAELNGPLLGVNKRIVQIATHFKSSPMIFKSYACPHSVALDNCVSIQFNSSSTNSSKDEIVLGKDVPYFDTLPPNTRKKYLFYIDGDSCKSNVKVISHFSNLLTCANS